MTKPPTKAARPIENCYAIPSGVGFAGQYPRDLDVKPSLVKINAILDADVTVFIDLTEPAEWTYVGRLLPYESIVREEADRRDALVEYQRHPVPDQSVPHDKRLMREILNAIDDAERRGKLVYLHCWGGKGRTGTTVACHLIRRGHSANEALRQVQKLAQTMPKGLGVPVPENDRQRAFVRHWETTD